MSRLPGDAPPEAPSEQVDHFARCRWHPVSRIQGIPHPSAVGSREHHAYATPDALDARGICAWGDFDRGGPPPDRELDRTCEARRHLELAKRVDLWHKIRLAERLVPLGRRSNVGRVVRGGSWNNNRDNVRSDIRNRRQPDNRNNNVGFRVVCASSPALRVGLLKPCLARAARFKDRAGAPKCESRSRSGVDPQPAAVGQGDAGGPNQKPAPRGW